MGSPIGSLDARARSIPLNDSEGSFIFPVEQGLHRDAEFVPEVIHRLASEHSLTCSASKLAE